MKSIIAKAKVREGMEAEFEALALALAAQVEANEAGNQLYKVCRSPEGHFVFVELYDDESAIAAHRASAHMKEVSAQFVALLAGPPEVTILDVLGD